MVWFSYHSGHSGEFCRHAKDNLRAVVARAIALGFTHYGLSEHAPRFREEDLFPDEADLSPSDLSAIFERYAREAVRLRDAHIGEITLLVGFETERLPPDSWQTRMHDIRSSIPFDYIVGSVHDVDGHVIDFSAEKTDAIAAMLGSKVTLQIRYFDALTELITTLKPEIVGHIDLVRKFEPDGFAFSAVAMRAVEKTLEAAKAFDCALDVNCGALRRGLGPVYPLPSILERARQMGIRVTLGDDSHGVATVGVGLDACITAIGDAGYREISYLDREDGAVVWRTAALEDVKPKRKL